MSARHLVCVFITKQSIFLFPWIKNQRNINLGYFFNLVQDWFLFLGTHLFISRFFIYFLFINLFKVNYDKKDAVYKNTYKIAWG